MNEATENATLAYLHRIIYYAAALTPNKTSINKEETDGETLVETLARLLLEAANPSNLTRDVPNVFLPQNYEAIETMEQESNHSDSDSPYIDEEENAFPPFKHTSRFKGGRPRPYTRIDALRSLLRCLAPIAMDVAVRAAARILMDSRTKGDTGNPTSRLHALVLFGIWIGEAPQLAQIVSDLFGMETMSIDEKNSCPIAELSFVAKRMSRSTADEAEAREAVVVAEAVQELLYHYCSKRYEREFVRKWWDWDSCLFVLLHAHGKPPEVNDVDVTDESTDEAMDVDVAEGTSDAADTNGSTLINPLKDLKFYIGGYSPETNAPHCKDWRNPLFQTKWYTARAIGSLFALRSLPLSKFLKRMGVFEQDVPFVRHPWTVMEEEVYCEVHRMNGVGRIVLPNIETLKIKFGHCYNHALTPEARERDEFKKRAQEEAEQEASKEYLIQVPSSEDIRQVIQMHPSLVHIGNGVLLPRRGSVTSYMQYCRSKMEQNERPSHPSSLGTRGTCFIPTDTTTRNMAMLGVAMSNDPHPPPILICGPTGSGKSSLVRELSRKCSSFASESNNSSGTKKLCQEDELLELHVDEETDSKTLLGSYVATDIPGEFVWMAGPLTSAARTGRWVLIEDLDRCPEEIQASFIRLLEERILPLGVGKEEKCHPRFRLFGTCATNASLFADGHVHNARRKSVSSAGSNGKRVLHPSLWRKVHLDPLPFSELQSVGRKLHPDLPHFIADAVLDVLRKLDRSGRNDSKDEFHEDNCEQYTNTDKNSKDILGHGSRHVSVRDYIKLLSRISTALEFEPGTEYATETQRLICLTETVDVFAMSCPHIEKRRDFICQIAPIWRLTADAATRYVESRIPGISIGGHGNNHRRVDVGRARLTAVRDEDIGLDGDLTPGKRRNFAETHHALRFMESVAVCVSANEPALLVGETGCGKTTLVQRLASLTGRQLLVLNLSLQTDSTDLLGGYKPLEIKHVARGVYDVFVDLFVSSFSRSQNAQFLRFVLNAYEKGDWKKLAQCFVKAADMGEKKVRQGTDQRSIELWNEFRQTAERFERQRVASESGMAFLFSEGALVDALRTGKWVLLDEINLASSETLQRLCGLLDNETGSITLTEKGDAEAVERHPDFRLFAAMNPATDAGKKDLPASIRSRFTELYVDELIDPNQLRFVASRYLDGAVVTNGVPLEHSESVMTAVDTYLECRLLSEQSLVDGAGQRPRYTMRTLCRALAAARSLIIQQRYSPQRAILEGFELAFEGSLDLPSRLIVQKLFNSSLSKGLSSKERDHPGRRPDGKNGIDTHVLIKPFWLKSGNEEQTDWSEPNSSSNGRPKFVLTPSATANLRRLCQAVASGPWSVLLEGPTSAGKTSLVEYLAKRIGHRCVRINNHEHTDIQEYTGSYAADSNGKISFQEGILVQALRKGYWVILDELNLAPSEVLEALNRLLDDNRELYLAEINEVVKPHPNFRLFATQNPAGAYGGRKPLSRAFRNRFVEIHMADIPENEMTVILDRRCGCPPSHAKLLVKVMKSLRQRRSRTGVFRGKDGLVTPRDLLRWAERSATSKLELAREGFMLLAERLRVDEEKNIVQAVIEKELNVKINMEESYYGENSEGRLMLEQALSQESQLSESGLNVNSIAPTKSILRLLSLVMRCIKQKEPVLLVGDTGCGKTTVVQLLSVILKAQLTVVNCHASTETSDLLGGFRPIRGRQNILQEMTQKVSELIQNWNDSSFDISSHLPPSLDSPKAIIDFLHELSELYVGNKNNSASTSEKSNKKRRKLANGSADVASTQAATDRLHGEVVLDTLQSVSTMYQKYTSLFEWVDGPLVCAMKQGSMLLLDEMSLAEDAVLERLNSVLEPSRTITLAEKGGEGPVCAHEVNTAHQSLSSEVKADEHFRVFATMNPGGDFGKRELSPALRSRFTEIWVPEVTHRLDVELVLERSFLSCTSSPTACPMDATDSLRNLMLDYVEWFNGAICDDPNTFCNDFKLSLRDILSWARFIADVSVKHQVLDQYSAYLHGAALMHLDGVGLGTGVSNHDASETRDKAKTYLLEQIASICDSSHIIGFKDELEELGQFVIDTDKAFGIQPFTISKGKAAIPTESQFHMTAPTTGMNLRRVLRGMQISKPILLEGSPGVGKTSLISALASASGHNLVRINLSEQTDISDLMGNDLPCTSESNNDGSSHATFRWCDGVLLQAIKRGDWVLLDELNLASQSVLEGLNSCLDHRASVYIPELGKSFDCPPSFRIFAAQNPLAQGGGRKGLPKSFLNRFTKVYVEALTRSDLLNIVSDQFPSIPMTLVTNMVDINCGIQNDIVQSRLYGQQGSPWEFNLRDVFRWCQLLVAKGGDITPPSAAKYADILYTQRLRTPQDRLLVKKRIDEYLGSDAIYRSPPRLSVSKTHVVIGTTAVERNLDESTWSDISTQESEASISQALFGPMEAVASCVNMNWPCLLVGSSSSGKTSLLKVLSDACNVHVETLAMSSSTDVTELIGCFEQTDSMKIYKEILGILRRIYNTACLSEDVDAAVLLSVVKNYSIIDQKTSSCLESFTRNESVLTAMNELLSCYESIASYCPAFNEIFSSEILYCRQWLSSTKNENNTKGAQSPFQWVDGTLVQAMERGYWLHLENVNYCPSSVLDRLNPLMEFGGELIVTECGITNNEAKPRVIRPHSNFRLFLSMDPNSHGEVSRAMRNRCIEVCIIPPSFDDCGTSRETNGDQVKNIDALSGLFDCNIRSHDIAQYMVTTHYSDCKQSLMHHEDVPTIKSLKGWGSMFSSLLKRGTPSSIHLSHHLLYETYDINDAESISPTFSGLIRAVSSRQDLLLDSFNGELAQFGRLVRVMTSCDQDYLGQISAMGPYDFDLVLPNDSSQRMKLRFQSINRLLETIYVNDLQQLLSVFDGYCTGLASQIKIIILLFSLMLRHLPKIRESGKQITLMEVLNEFLSENCDDDHAFRAKSKSNGICFAARLYYSLEEALTYCHLDHSDIIPSLGDMNVLAISYCINEKRIEVSDIMCPVTPFLFPLFQLLDALLHKVAYTEFVSAELEKIMSCRDRLWQFLTRSNNIGIGLSSQVGTSFGGFLTNYTWLKKAICNFYNSLGNSSAVSDSEHFQILRQLQLAFDKIDRLIEESMGGSISSSDILWKKGGHPLLPSSLDNLKVLSTVQGIASQCTLVNEDLFGFTRMVSPTLCPIDVNKLVRENHPCLYLSKDFALQLLGAISTIFWATTDEIKDELSTGRNNTCNAITLSIMETFKHQSTNFVRDLNFSTIDTTIKTVENTLDLEAIRGLGEESKPQQSGTDFVHHLVDRLGQIQKAQLGEIWCLRDEETIIFALSSILQRNLGSEKSRCIEELRKLRSKILSFIKKFTSHTLWSVEDLRPYQTLAWVLDSEKALDSNVFFRTANCLLSRMLSSFHSHHWCNSFNDLESVSSNLQGPALWNKDYTETHPSMVCSPMLSAPAKSTLIASCAGPVRIKMNAHRGAIFRLLHIPAGYSDMSFYTMENGDARQSQASSLLKLFTHCKEWGKYTPIDLIKYHFSVALLAIKDGCDTASIIKLLDDPPTNSVDMPLESDVGHELNVVAGQLVEKIQLLNVTDKRTSLYRSYLAQAWIYIGLFRLQLLVPSSPIDPGRKPAAKVEQLDFVISDISSNILSMSLHTGLSDGDFDPNSPMVKLLCDEKCMYTKKRSHQRKKIIERPPSSPSFYDLYREMHNFCKTVSVEKVTNMIKLIETSSNSSFRSHETNFQCSAVSFCTRLSTTYSMYEDVTIPCINEIRSIQRGLRELSLCHAQSYHSESIIQVQNSLLTYPSTNKHSLNQIEIDTMGKCFDELLLQFGLSGRNGAKSEMTSIVRSCHIASLFRLHLRTSLEKNHSGITSEDFQSVTSCLSMIANSSVVDSELPEKDGITSHESDAEKEERELREYFPDHSAEFQRIITRLDEYEEDQNDDHLDFTQDVDTQVPRLSDHELSLAVSLHNELFSSTTTVDDKLRTKVFVSSYDAASRMGELANWMTNPSDEESFLGSHILALALRCNTSRNVWLPSLHSDHIRDFHNDPFPSESIKANAPLRELLMRIAQLLRAFPGHSVLVGLGQVVERIRQLDIQMVSLGKIMSGLEVILRRAQDWEQHASQHVQLGKPLRDISALVTSWRKLELHSWSSLLTMREKRRGLRANRHWPKLYGLIHKDRANRDIDHECRKRLITSTHLPAMSPKWIWKGFPQMTERLGLDNNTESIEELAKVLDTFILTSNLAECKERLALIQAFAKELEHECCFSGHKRLPLARFMCSLRDYYERLMPILIQQKDKQREPIEKRLKDEVKLAKWDEQTYYSLAESSEKNHRKLMKFLRDYDEVLDTTAMSILEQNFVEGIRSVNQTKAGEQEPITAIPGNSTIFPSLTSSEIEETLTIPRMKVVNSKLAINISNDEWATAGLLDVVDKYITGMDHYNKRMTKVMASEVSWAMIGATCVGDLVEAIFSRIESLRKDVKSTKQMKQRALVDLFKCLKERGGYSSMKWSVPPQIREAHQMLQLPTPSCNNTPKNIREPLEKGESYFHRCQVEISRLRSEISTLGSQYMSQREMILMQGYSDHMLFLLCQERCLIADMISTISGFQSFFDGYGGINDIPFGQVKLSQDTSKFERSLAFTIEGFWQLVLLLKEASSLVDLSDGRNKVRDSINVLTGCAHKLEETYTHLGGKTPVSFDRVHNISVDMVQVLGDCKRDIFACAEACQDILPSSVFESCATAVDESLELAVSFSQHNTVSASEGTGSVNEKTLSTLNLISDLMQKTLVTAQSISTSKAEHASLDQSQTLDVKVCDSHMKMVTEWEGLHLTKLKEKVQELSTSLLSLHDGDETHDDSVRLLCTRAAINSFTLVQKVLSAATRQLHDALVFYRQHTKLLYVLLRVFRVLIAKGFCSDDVSDGGDGDGEGGAGEMKFEDDVEGTGMGEGEGKNDVTDQIENEEQLLGLKGEEEQDAASSQQKKEELNQDEVDTGMEMEGDFNGDMYDMPEQQDENEDQDNGDNEEEVDREMGDGSDPNEQVVDEKMWDDEDDLDDLNQEEEKFEDGSKMAGEKLDDEMRTRDEPEDDINEQGKQDAEQHDADQNTPDDSADNTKDENINDDTEDKYEDSHGVDVRDEQNAPQNDEQDLDIDLNEGLNIDDQEEEKSPDNGEDGNSSDLEETMDDVPEAESIDGNNSETKLEDEEEAKESEPMDIAGQGGNIDNQIDDSKEEEPEEEHKDDDEQHVEHSAKNQHETQDQLHGVAAPDGEDAVKEKYDEDQKDEAKDDGNAEEDAGGAEENTGESSNGSGGNGNDGSWQSGQAKEQEQEQGQVNNEFEVPNPFRSPGDAEKFWHKKLDIVNDNPENEDCSPQDTSQESEDLQEQMGQDGVYEYSKENQDSSGQVLGAADEEQAKQLQENEEDEFQPKDQNEDSANVEMTDRNESKRDTPKQSQSDSTPKTLEEMAEPESQQDNIEDKEDEVSVNQNHDIDKATKLEKHTTDNVQFSNRMSSEVSDAEDMEGSVGDIQEIEVSTELNILDLQEARMHWQTIQSETNNLSRRLCEKLRLVMEPLVATKLRGDYRTGKRVNMKRIIGYIASGYRKDKIWLRRTKPAKRDYRILITVDDSESMQKSKAGDMALRALSTLANGMSQLEIGQLGVASFGSEMKLIHPFNLPFTSESGVNVVSNFTFSQKRTRTALCVESAIAALESADSVSSSMQLVFMISDGRIERDSRSKLRRLIRQMAEENMLMVMIIVEGEDTNKPPSQGNESILNMKEVSFVKGKPQIKHFIEDYPFPYYLVVNDLSALPEILGDALRQWFEMMAQIKNGV